MLCLFNGHDVLVVNIIAANGRVLQPIRLALSPLFLSPSQPFDLRKNGLSAAARYFLPLGSRGHKTKCQSLAKLMKEGAPGVARGSALRWATQTDHQ
jgi:hypothetical protein